MIATLDIKDNQDRELIRRARCLVAFWEEKEFVIENYLTKKQTTIVPLIAHLLLTVDNYQPKQSILQHFGSIPHASAVIEQLITQDVLIVQGSLVDIKDSLVAQSWKWKHDARYFHYSTQSVLFQDIEEEHSNLARLARESPPPPPFKEYDRSDVRLLGSFEYPSDEFWNILSSRRTRRLFKREAISFQDFSTLLLWTWGQTQTITDPEIGQYILKTSPSGGARHPIEVYPIVLRVEGIEPGIYHYSVKRHVLECLQKGDFDNLVVSLCANQKWLQNAAVVFFMTAIVARSMWKYSHSHAYRVLLLDAGHLGQTFHLVCTKLGLAPFTTAASQDGEIENMLNLDGVSEIPIYTAAVGLPA